MDKKTKRIEQLLMNIYQRIGIDKPTNHDTILTFVKEDVDETADPVNWTSSDVEIGFRRFVEQIN